MKKRAANTLRIVPGIRPDPLFDDCTDCGLLAWGVAACLTATESADFARRIEHRRARKTHELLHRAGAMLTSLYVIRSGFMKSSVAGSSGREQITGFLMPGDLIGMDAIATGRHQCSTIALEDSIVCGIVFADFEQLAHDIPALQQHFHQSLGREITRDHGMMMLLGAMRAEERVAAFLLNLSRRLAARGLPDHRFHLPMGRQDIGNYLGLTLETVSRAFSHLSAKGLIAIAFKEVEILDAAALHNIARSNR